MSGRSRGRKSSRAKSRGKSRAQGGACAAADDDARRDATPPPQSRRPGEDTAAAAAAAAQVQAQVQAGAGRGGLESAAPGDAAACGLPLDCGLALRARTAADRGLAATDPGPAKATSLAQRLAGDSVFVGTVGALARPKNGPHGGNRRVPLGKKVPEARSFPMGRGAQVVLGGKANKGPPAGQCATGSVVGEEKKVMESRAGSGPPATEGSMDTLETVQLKLETMNAQADRAYLRLSRKFGQLRLHHLERRNLLIQSIPGFWGQAFQNHPQLSSFLNNKDKEVLGYLNKLEVEELGLARLGYKIKFYFGQNPYFQNKVLIKEYGCGPSGQVVCRSVPIQWLPGHDLQSLSQGSPENNPSFFGWFSNHSSIESDKIVEIINEDLWPNPLQYYLMSEPPRGERGKEGKSSLAKQPVKAPEPGMNQSR